MSERVGSGSSIGIIAGAGSLPFAVADSLLDRNITPTIFAIRGFCETGRLSSFRHHWIALGQAGRLMRLLRAERCGDIVFIGGLVRPTLSEIRLDWGTLRLLPSIASALRGGDDHLLSGIGRIFERHGFSLRGIKEIAPDLLMPVGSLTHNAPDTSAREDIKKGFAALHAMSPFDIGQALVVIDGHVVAVEDIEGTDGLLARIALLRSEGRIRTKVGAGVLVKAPKSNQDMRFDLPTLGPKTIDGVIAAGLSGIAIAAGHTIVADPQEMIAIADKAGVFISGEST